MRRMTSKIQMSKKMRVKQSVIFMCDYDSLNTHDICEIYKKDLQMQPRFNYILSHPKVSVFDMKLNFCLLLSILKLVLSVSIIKSAVQETIHRQVLANQKNQLLEQLKVVKMIFQIRIHMLN